MKRSPALLALILCFAVVTLSCGGGGGGTPTAPSSGTTPPPPGGSPSPPATTQSWTAEGTLFTNATAGISGTMADTTTLRLNDGRWRMFLFAGQGYRSAISSDGLAWTMEAGQRLPNGNGQSRVVRLDDGRVRMYHISQGGISSSISTDEGLTFTLEGQRISASAAGLGQLSGPGIARTSDGRWRMYFTELDVPGAAVVPLPMKSAWSTDLLTWTMDPGVRVGPGATLSGSAAHPAAITNSNGSVTVYFFRNADLRLYAATSADGVAFTSEVAVFSDAADPDVVALPGGGLRMYYNWFVPSTGAYSVSSARSM
jgi:hypothetical protein